MSIKNGRKHGIARSWHHNGMLLAKQRFQNGLLHGRCYQWDDAGRLLGEFEMNHGTGVQREWHDNRRLKVEISTLDGIFCGRNRIWLRDGTLVSERFYVEGKEISPVAYANLSARDDSIPRYSEQPANPPRKTIATQRHAHETFIGGLFEKPNRAKVRTWLTVPKESKSARSLGRFRSQGAAETFVEKLYEAGAIEVIVPAIYRDKKDNEFADSLLVQLPKTKMIRNRIREICATLRRRSLGSFLPETDIGETHLYLSME